MKIIKAVFIYIISMGFSIAKSTIWFSTITPDNGGGLGLSYGGNGGTTVTTDENTILGTINIVNGYLRLAIGAIALGVLVYGGFKLISSQGDEKKLKEANSLILGAFVGIVIASMGYALIKVVVNLF